jgi:hypothetical protein
MLVTILPCLIYHGNHLSEIKDHNASFFIYIYSVGLSDAMKPYTETYWVKCFVTKRIPFDQ